MALIYNPKAGKGNMELHLVDMVNAFSKENFEVTLVPTKKKGYLKDYIAEEGRRFDVVTVCGGDGTVNEAFNGLMNIIEEERPLLGYIPRGTTNDFAASSTIPKDVSRATDVILHGRETRIDAGKFNEEYFSYVAAFGAFTFVAYDTPQQSKNIFGYAAYIIEGIKRINTIKPYRLKITVGDEVYEEEFLLGVVANSHSVGGMKITRVSVDLSDGLFEVILFKNLKSAGDVNAIIADLMNKRTKSDYYYIFRTDKLVVEADEKIAWTLDGEYGGEHTVAVIENMHNAIKIRVAEE